MKGYNVDIKTKGEKTMILQEAISTYLAYCIEQKTLSPKTTKAYQIDLQQFAEFTQNKYDREHIQKYITQLHKAVQTQNGKAEDCCAESVHTLPYGAGHHRHKSIR